MMLLLSGGRTEQFRHQRVHQQQEGRVQLRANKEQGRQCRNDDGNGNCQCQCQTKCYIDVGHNVNAGAEVAMGVQQDAD